MTSLPLFALATILSLTAWLVVLGLIAVPLLAERPRRERLMILVAPQCFRHVSVLLLMPGFALPTIPAHWVIGTVAGDVLTAIMAMLSVLLLYRQQDHAEKLVWATTLIGLGDLVKNVAYAMVLDVPRHMTVATAIPILVVPLMAVLHVLVLRQLLRGAA